MRSLPSNIHRARSNGNHKEHESEKVRPRQGEGATGERDGHRSDQALSPTPRSCRQACRSSGASEAHRWEQLGSRHVFHLDPRDQIWRRNRVGARRRLWFHPQGSMARGVQHLQILQGRLRALPFHWLQYSLPRWLCLPSRAPLGIRRDAGQEYSQRQRADHSSGNGAWRCHACHLLPQPQRVSYCS